MSMRRECVTVNIGGIVDAGMYPNTAVLPLLVSVP